MTFQIEFILVDIWNPSKPTLNDLRSNLLKRLPQAFLKSLKYQPYLDTSLWHCLIRFSSETKTKKLLIPLNYFWNIVISSKDGISKIQISYAKGFTYWRLLVLRYCVLTTKSAWGPFLVNVYAHFVNTLYSMIWVARVDCEMKFKTL